MPKITYIEHDGTKHTVDATIGDTVMETALAQRARHRRGMRRLVQLRHLPRLCRGGLAGAVGPRNAEEEDQLDFAFDVRPNSRLACQIKVTEELDGLVVHTPAYQGR